MNIWNLLAEETKRTSINRAIDWWNIEGSKQQLNEALLELQKQQGNYGKFIKNHVGEDVIHILKYDGKFSICVVAGGVKKKLKIKTMNDDVISFMESLEYNNVPVYNV
jgi:hypothetical protein